ncbi:MAG: porin [Alphaproteobacteria bacterium]|nr:porin [Alphaproteobacteria bacterium]
MLKKILCISVMSCQSLIASYEDTEEVKLLHEKVDEFLANVGFGNNLSFSGDGNLAITMTHQKKNNSEIESGYASYEGNIDLHYLNRTSDFGYGFEFSVKTRSGMIKTGRAIVDELYAFIETDKLGRLNIGFTATAADNFTIGGNSIFTAYGGPDSGNLSAFYNESAGTIIGTGCHVDDGKAAKIAWFSPTIKGFSMGMSFTLDSKKSAPFKKRHCSENCNSDNNICWDYAHSSGFSRSIFTIAGKYEYGNEDDFNATVTMGGWFGKGKAGTNTGAVHDVRAYQIGAILGYKQFKAAFGFIDCGRSIVDKYRAVGDSYIFDETTDYDVHDPRVGLKHGTDAGKIYTYGLSYKMDNLTLSAGYFRSVVKFSDKKSERAIANIYTVGAEYRFDKTLSIYAEYNNISTKTCDRARIYAKACNLGAEGANHANMLILGSKINF